MQPVRVDGKLAAVLCDFDGVLADASDALATMPPGGWEWYHDQIGQMRVLNNGVPELLRYLYRGGTHTIILTCRPVRYADTSEAWLHRYGVKHHELMCRPEGVKHQDWKRQAVVELKRRYTIVLALDDNPAEIAMYQELDVPGLLVYSPDWAPGNPTTTWTEEQKYG